DMAGRAPVGPRHTRKAYLAVRRLVGHHLEPSATVPAPHALDPAPAEAAAPVVDQRGPRRAHVADASARLFNVGSCLCIITRSPHGKTHRAAQPSGPRA